MLTADVKRVGDFKREWWFFILGTMHDGRGNPFMTFDLQMYIREERVNINGDWIETKRIERNKRKIVGRAGLPMDVEAEARQKLCDQIMKMQIT